MTETKPEISTSVVDTVKSYIMSKRMIYLVVAIVLCVGIYVYMNRKPKVVEESNQQQQQQMNEQPEMVFSQELVENLYRNNSNPIQYLIQLQQQGQIPNGPLPKIVIDNTVHHFIPQQPVQQQREINQQQREINQQNLNETKDNNEIESVINYVNEEENDSKNQYQRIEEDDDGEIVNQQLTQEEIDRINKKILNKST